MQDKPKQDTDACKEALDILIDQNQRLFAIYDARRGNAETKAAGILTADVAIAAATATAVGVAKHVKSLLLVGLLVLLLLLVASVICALYTGAAAGLYRRLGVLKKFVRAGTDRPSRQHPADARPLGSADGPTPGRKDKGPLLSTESTEYRRAASSLDHEAEKLCSECDRVEDAATRVRLRTLELWQRRREDAHEAAKRKDQGVGAAGGTLGVALLWGAFLFAAIIVAHV